MEAGCSNAPGFFIGPDNYKPFKNKPQIANYTYAEGSQCGPALVW